MLNMFAMLDAAAAPEVILFMGLSAGKVVVISALTLACLIILVRALRKKKKNDERDD